MWTADAPDNKSTFPQGTGCEVTVDTFGKLKDGREAKLFTLTNKNGVVAKISNYGALLTHLFVPDREGNAQDLTHGFDKLADWEVNEPYFGATVGRFGNRIADGSFTLDGETLLSCQK